MSSGLNRDVIDKFYTKPKIAKLIIEKFQELIKVSPDDIIIEPSAGDGKFSNILIPIFEKVISYDIKPEEKYIIKKDFLELDLTEFKNKTIHIIGNPPFGRQSSLAKKFIKKCCKFSSTITFILPKSFKKISCSKVFDEYFHLIFQEDLPKNSFLLNDVEYDVPCIYQIWIKKDNTREIKKLKLKTEYFSFTKNRNKCDISIRRVGVNAGNLFTNEHNKKSIQSHYFININKNLIELQRFINIYKKIIFDVENTVGPKSISKGELIEKFELIINQENLL